MQVPDLWDRKNKDRKIGYNGGGGIRNPSANLVDAVTGKLWVPDLLDRYTDEEEHESDTDNPNDNETSDDERPFLEVGKAEYAVVHHQEAELCPYKVKDIQDLGDEQELGHHNNIWYGDFTGVESHTVFHHTKYESHYHEIPCL